MPTKRPPPWHEEENAEIIALYFLMHHKASTGQPYNKAAMIRGIQCIDGSHQRLSSRSHSSIECKLMNVTAALHDLDRFDVSMAEHGYRPLSNYQAGLKEMLIPLLAVRDAAVAGEFNAA